MNTKFHSFNGLEDVESGVQFLDFDGSDVESGDFSEFSVRSNRSSEKFSNIVGLVAAARLVEANRLLKNLTNAEKQRFEQIKQEQASAGVRDNTNLKAKARLVNEILNQKDKFVDETKDRLLREKKAKNKFKAKKQAENLWEDQRKALLAQEAKTAKDLAVAGEELRRTLGRVRGGERLQPTPVSNRISEVEQQEEKTTTAGALPELPATNVADALPTTDASSNTNTVSTESKPNYLVWGGIGLAVLTLGFLAYRKYYSK